MAKQKQNRKTESLTVAEKVVFAASLLVITVFTGYFAYLYSHAQLGVSLIVVVVYLVALMGYLAVLLEKKRSKALVVGLRWVSFLGVGGALLSIWLLYIFNLTYRW